METEFKGTPEKCLTLDDAEILCQKTDYAIDCCDEGNPINWGDAAAFFLEGVLYERKATSRLIAAAPELLEALQNMVNIMDGLTEAYPALKNETAILKAKGAIAKALEG